MTYPISSPSNPYRPRLEKEYSEGDYSQFEDELGFENEDEYLGESSPVGNMTARQLRSRVEVLKAQLEGSSLKLSDRRNLQNQLESLESQIDMVQGLSPKQRDAQMASIQGQLGRYESEILGIGEDNDLPGGWGDEDIDQPEVSREKIQDLLGMVDRGERKPEEDSKLTKEACAKLLREALEDEASGKSKAAGSAYAEVLETLGGEKEPKELAEDLYGETPSKVEKDVVHFDGKESGSLQLRSPGNGKTAVVENTKEVQLTPKDKEDPVTVADEGGYYVITMGKDTFKVDKEAKLRIVSDHVTGDVRNAEGKITSGASEKTARKFSSPAYMKEVAEKLANADISPWFEDDDPSEGPRYRKGKYGIQGEIYLEHLKTGKAQEVLQAVAEALRETDPTKQKDLWDEASEALGRVKAALGGAAQANDFAQIVFNVLYGEIGKDEFKNFLREGVIPKDFAKELGAQLKGQEDEIDVLGSEMQIHRGLPGEDWSHGSSAAFLKKYSGGSSEGPEDSKDQEA